MAILIYSDFQFMEEKKRIYKILQNYYPEMENRTVAKS